MSKRKYRTDFLFPKSGFWVGMGSALNVYGNYFRFNYSHTAEEADEKAMEADWGVIGQDITDIISDNPPDKLLKEYA